MRLKRDDHQCKQDLSVLLYIRYQKRKKPDLLGQNVNIAAGRGRGVRTGPATVWVRGGRGTPAEKQISLFFWLWLAGFKPLLHFRTVRRKCKKSETRKRTKEGALSAAISYHMYQYCNLFPSENLRYVVYMTSDVFDTNYCTLMIRSTSRKKVG